MELIEINQEHFNEIYTDMVLQFPPEELKSKETFCKLLKDPRYKVLGVYDKKLFAGYTIIFEGGNFILVDYVAILKNAQSKGYGSKILKLLPEKFKDKSGVFFEVEKISDTNPQTAKRAKFYTTNGAKKLDINYIYPNNSGGLPMDLYYLSFNNLSPDLNCILGFIKEMFGFLHKDIKNIDEIYSNIG